MSILVFGHKNPDTDSICSAIAMAELQTKLGKDIKAVRLGNLNKETEYILNYFNIELPELIEKVKDEQEVILVDHNEKGQSVDNRDNSKILLIVDHHKIDLSTADPINLRFETVGCTSTIIAKLFKENNLVPSKEIAGLMLSAIISDTLLFKSPTCTDEDIKQAKYLAEIAEIDYEKYGMDMLIAGTSVDDKTAEEIYNMDMKPFSFGDQTATVAQVNTVNINDILKRKNELIKVMQEKIKNDKLSFALLMITDIVNKGTELLVVGDKTLANKTFGLDMSKDTVYLEGVVSRKKQIVPPLTNAAN
ncbi:manganese-dependent inorganic pyrophosphatase [Hypnocyclicus thermotrophus]|uniref:inorganic diphosphatase n=1 Tax=Hypnocyclicus thermotrophus TaxID=1627895 RepID=A0AA46DWZ5_9FUSO|nr:manganese-dependent inorganic pyrophosphatase [Hypnocyclicus thermotrophus]TDT67016.1 manganese-dependent inorganic pyrophosphatase [Hypnocyclicus thermotrophus]